MSPFSIRDGLLVVTGATGWVGRTAMHELQKLLPPEEFVQRVKPFASREGVILTTAYSDLEPISIPIYPLEDLPRLANSESIQAIFHSAFLTRDRLADLDLEVYTATNRWITNQVAKALKFSPSTKAVIVSSGAAAVFDNHSTWLSRLEEDPYGVLKKEEEISLSGLSQSLVLRLYALSGRFIRKPRRFALGDFLMMALNGEAIRINASHPVVRSYGNAGDIGSIGWHWLLDPHPYVPSDPIAAVNIQIDLVTLAQKIKTIYGLPEVISNKQLNSSG